jgi:hypothetical protein
MKKIKTGSLFLGLIFSLCINVRAQDDTLVELREKFQDYSVNHLQEKIFVHTDKDFYLTGETLWLKIYDVDGTFHKPLALNKIAYIEIINTEKIPVAQAKIKLKDGKGNGSITLPELKTGTYVLRAYTRWMRNYSSDLFFEKTLTIANVKEPLKEKQNPLVVANDVDIQFFPEGGNLVYSLQSKVGFKVTDHNGNGLPGRGVVLNQENDTLVHFETLKFGMGSFAFTPVKGQSYTVRATVNGKQLMASLPAIMDEGYVMQVAERGDSLRIRVSYAGSQAPQKIFLLAHTRQFFKTSDAGNLRNNTTDFSVSKKSIGDGITHITIFDENKLPVCQRLFFRKPESSLRIETSFERKIVGPREAVSFNIITGKGDQKLSANLSLSVFMVDSLQKFEGEQMLTNLMLSSDLKGKVESPDYYILSNDPEVQQATENLMLTQGWRRFKWDNVLEYKLAPQAFAPEYEGMVVAGKTTRTTSDSILLTLPGTGRLYSSTTDASGNFQFYIDDAYGKSNMVLVPMSGGDKSQYQLVDPFDDRSVSTAISDGDVLGNYSQLFNERSIHAQVMKSGASLNKKLSTAPADTVPFYGKPSVTYKLQDYVMFPTFEEVLREYVPEVIVRRKNKKLHLFALDKDREIFFTDEPLVMVDGIPVRDTDKIVQGNAKNIKQLSVVTKKYFHGSVIFSGIVSLETFNKDFSGFELDTTSFVFSFDGLAYEQEFYSPRYETASDLGSRKPDFRNVLYWAPEIVTAPDGKKQITFYTADTTGTFVGVLHGITEDGLPGTHSFFFQVRENPK